jgi:hypothetical protein
MSEYIDGAKVLIVEEVTLKCRMEEKQERVPVKID